MFRLLTKYVLIQSLSDDAAVGKAIANENGGCICDAKEGSDKLVIFSSKIVERMSPPRSLVMAGHQ